MPLIVETGAGIEGANSFATLDQARDFATLRGVTLPASDAALTAFLVKGTDFLKTFLYQGTQTYDGDTYLPFPRTNMYVNGVKYDYETVPVGIVEATCQLAIEQFNGVELNATSTGFGVKLDKVGPITTEYAVPTGAGNAPKANMPAVMAYLKPYRLHIGIRTGRA